MDLALRVVIGYLKEMSMPVSTEEDIYNICLVSSNNDKTVARIVA
jgi:chaperonin GroEL (HSP60 family)